MILVSEDDLSDLRNRLQATRWPQPWPGTGDLSWTAGTPAGELRRLAEYWADGYDWPFHEAAINALPWHSAVIDAVPVRYLRFEARRSGALPLLLTNGWPSSFYELVGLARRLSETFTVIVPCLPGFPGAPVTAVSMPTHELWHRLMSEHLGFAHYGAHGGDLGAGTTARLAQAHPSAVTGIHVMSVADPVHYDLDSLTDEERAYLAEVAAWFSAEGAYEHQQMTRPTTLSYGLSDSPVGLLGWLLEKYHAWGAGFDDDAILTQASLYWHTNTIATSFRPYWDYAEGRTERVLRVDVPTAVAVFPGDLTQPPRSWAERSYNVVRYTRMPRGGHFSPHDEPDLLAADLTEFFADLA